MSCQEIQTKLNAALRRHAYSDRQTRRLYNDLQTGTRISTQRCEVSGPKLLPHELTCEQREARVRSARLNLARYNNDPERFVERIIAIDESWMRC